jgi:protein phosphatase
MALEVGAASDKGRVRTHNEDAFALRAEQGLFVVCDGMGGTAAGEVASRLAVEAIVEHVDRSLEGGSAGPADSYLRQTVGLAAAVRLANQRIFEQARRNPRQAEMGTTVVAARIGEGVASLAHVGDSRAYLWHAARLEPLTRDHSLVEEQVRAGLLDREASLQSEQQNILVRALGREPEVEVDVNEVPLQAGDYLMLCSDGLTRTVSERVMETTIADLRAPQRICDILIEAANRNGGPDNITVVIVEVTGGWWQRFSSRFR